MMYDIVSHEQVADGVVNVVIKPDQKGRNAKSLSESVAYHYGVDVSKVKMEVLK